MAYLSAKYVERFRCIGEACGSACCRGWAIQLTREDRERLETALELSKSALGPLSNAVIPAPKGVATKTHPYVIQFNQHDACPFVTEAHQCRIHATLGEEALPDICAQYPREGAQVSGKKELWASLSCPEAARLCLLAPDGADRVELPEPIALRFMNTRLEIDDQTSDYVAYLGEIRDFVGQLLALPGYNLRCRLFFVAYFAHRVESYFHRGIVRVERQRLKQDMQALLEPRTLDKLTNELEMLNISGAYAVQLVQAVTEARTGLSEYPEPLPTETFAQLNRISTQSGHDEPLTTDPGLQHWIDYSLRRLRWERDFAPLLDSAFENYCKLFWLKDWYIRAPTLMAHATAGMLRLAILRYRLFTHPALENPSLEAPIAERQALLERTLVSVVTEVARAIEHDRPFLESLDTALAKRGMQDLAHTSMLLVL